MATVKKLSTCVFCSKEGRMIEQTTMKVGVGLHTKRKCDNCERYQPVEKRVHIPTGEVDIIKK